MTRTQRQIEEHRQGEVCIEVRDSAGSCSDVPIWAEQESHAFVFGCVLPKWEGATEEDWQRIADRLHEVFNRVMDDTRPDSSAIRVDVPDDVRLSQFQSELDERAEAGKPLEVWIRGASVGLNAEDDSRAVAERVAALYTLCFAHPAVCGIIWAGETVAGGGLLRRDGSPRPAFRYLHKLIGTVWHSRASGETDAAGRFRFRGFFGDYRVAARMNEAPATVAVFACKSEGGLPVVLTTPEPEASRRD